MAGIFQKDKTTAAQTAANVAGGVVSSLGITNVDDAAEAVVTIFEKLFAVMEPVVEADNANFIAQAEAAPAAPARDTTSSSRAKREGKTGGKSKDGGNPGGFRTPTLKDALAMKFKGGAFEGITLADVLDLDAETADDEYEYGDGEKDGRMYFEWLASDKNKNDFTRLYGQVVALAEGIEFDSATRPV